MRVFSPSIERFTGLVKRPICVRAHKYPTAFWKKNVLTGRSRVKFANKGRKTLVFRRLSTLTMCHSRQGRCQQVLRRFTRGTRFTQYQSCPRFRKKLGSTVVQTPTTRSSAVLPEWPFVYRGNMKYSDRFGSTMSGGVASK